MAGQFDRAQIYPGREQGLPRAVEQGVAPGMRQAEQPQPHVGYVYAVRNAGMGTPGIEVRAAVWHYLDDPMRSQPTAANAAVSAASREAWRSAE